MAQRRAYGLAGIVLVGVLASVLAGVLTAPREARHAVWAIQEGRFVEGRVEDRPDVRRKVAVPDVGDTPPKLVIRESGRRWRRISDRSTMGALVDCGDGSYATQGDTCARPLRKGDSVVTTWAGVVRAKWDAERYQEMRYVGVAVHRGAPSAVLSRLQSALWWAALWACLAWLASALCWGALLMAWRRRAERGKRASAEDSGQAMWEGALVDAVAHLCAVDVPELCATHRQHLSALRGWGAFAARSVAVACFVGLHGYAIAHVGRMVWAGLGYGYGESLTASSVWMSAFVAACGGVFAVEVAQAWRDRQRLREGDPEWAVVSDVLLQTLGCIAPWVAPPKQLALGCRRPDAETAHGHMVVVLHGERAQVSMGVDASPERIEVCLTALEGWDASPREQTRRDARWVWDRTRGALVRGGPARAQASGDGPAQVLAQTVRAWLSALGFGARRDTSPRGAEERASWDTIVRPLGPAPVSAPQRLACAPPGCADVARLERIPAKRPRWSGEGALAAGQAIAGAALVVTVGMWAWWRRWELLPGDPDVQWLAWPLLASAVVVGSVLLPVRYARRARSVRATHAELRWDGEVLALNDAQIELERPFRLDLTRDGTGDTALLGVTLAQTHAEGHGDVVRLRVAVPVEPCAALDALDALDHDAPVLPPSEFEAWVWPLIAFHAQAHGQDRAFAHVRESDTKSVLCEG